MSSENGSPHPTKSPYKYEMNSGRDGGVANGELTHNKIEGPKISSQVLMPDVYASERSSTGTGSMSSLSPSLIPLLPSPSPSPTDIQFSHSHHRSTISETEIISSSESAIASSNPSLELSPRNSSDTADYHAMLKIKKVIGTTAQSQSSFCAVGSTLAYTAGAGAVISQLDHKNGSVICQRFFCTSTKMVQAIQAASTAGHHINTNKLAWSMMFDSSISLSAHNSITPRDSYGFLLVGAENGARLGSLLTPILPSGINNDSLLSFGGNSSTIVSDYPSSPGSRSATSAKDKMKTTSSLALSSDGKLLAVGEIGHQPRIFIYSTASDSSPLPLAILNEHRFGIKFLAFSPCGRFLASLGSTNDGFLHIWSLHLKEGMVQLHSTNRCISVVNDLKWVGSSHILTAGVRHLRIWTVEVSKKVPIDSKPAVLAGRNVVMGEFSQANFSTITPLSDNMAVITTETGDIATLESDHDEKPIFQSRTSVGFEVTAVDFDISGHTIWVAGASGNIKGLLLETILSSGPISPTPNNCAPTQSLSKPARKPNHPLGIYGIAHIAPKTVLALRGKREISLLAFDQSIQLATSEIIIVASHSKELYGIRAGSVSDGEFLTWSADGSVRFWTDKGICKSDITVDECCSNDASVLTISCVDDEKKILVVGDSLGQVRFIDLSTKSVASSFQAHGSRVVDLDYRRLPNGRQLLVSSSRDRTIQIFLGPDEDTKEWTLHQTLEAHKGNIIATRITKDGERVISCAADRTVNIHKTVIDLESNKFVGFISEKIISLKSTPSDMCLDPKSDTFVVSSDKQILIYRVSGELLTSYRTVDSGFLNMGSVSSGESVNLVTISLGCLNDQVYLAGMGNDKSVRLYEHPSGTLIGSDWGHSEGISGLTWVYSADGSAMLASTGNDGCIFLWNVRVENGVKGLTASPVAPSANISSPVARLSPTRKILSKTELAKFMPTPQLNRSSQTPSPARRSLAPSPINKSISSNSQTSSPSSNTGSVGSKIPSKSSLPSTVMISRGISDSSGGSPAPRTGAKTEITGTRSTPRYMNISPPSKVPAPSSSANKPISTIGSRIRQSIIPKSSSNPSGGRRTLSSSKSFPILSVIPTGQLGSNNGISTPQTINDDSLEDLRKSLASFRARYSRDVINYEKQNKNQLKLLCQELKDTLKIMNPSYQEESAPAAGPKKTIPRSRSSTTSLSNNRNNSNDMQDMHDMLQQFGDKLISIVDSKLGNVPGPNTFGLGSTLTVTSTPSGSPSRSPSPFPDSLEKKP